LGSVPGKATVPVALGAIGGKAAPP